MGPANTAEKSTIFNPLSGFSDICSNPFFQQCLHEKLTYTL